MFSSLEVSSTCRCEIIFADYAFASLCEPCDTSGSEHEHFNLCFKLDNFIERKSHSLMCVDVLLSDLTL